MILQLESKFYGCIYKFTNIINNKSYIGKTIKDIDKYILLHFRKAMANADKDTKYFYRAIRKYGVENFKVEILEFCFSKKELNSAEIFYIDFNKSYNRLYGYNLTFGGDGGSPNKEVIKKLSEIKKGKKLTEEHRINIGKAGKGRVFSEQHRSRLAKSGIGKHSHNIGKKQTPETIRKISESNRGKKRTEEAKKKMSDSHRGKKLREEHKLEISKSLKGRQFSEDHRNSLSISQVGKRKNKSFNEQYGEEKAEQIKRKIREASSGKNNPMYGKSVFDIWVKKYGIEEALSRREKMNRKRNLTKKNKNDK